MGSAVVVDLYLKTPVEIYNNRTNLETPVEIYNNLHAQVVMAVFMVDVFYDKDCALPTSNSGVDTSMSEFAGCGWDTMFRRNVDMN